MFPLIVLLVALLMLAATLLPRPWRTVAIVAVAAVVAAVVLIRP